MKIKSIHFSDHPVLGNLSLDFTDRATGEPTASIVLAGENGCGKTVVLNEVYRTIGELEITGERPPLEICVELDPSNLADIRAVGERAANRNTDVGQLSELQESAVTFAYKTIGPGDWRNLTLGFQVGGRQLNLTSSLFFANARERPFRAFYSEANVGFNAPALNTITATGVDDLFGSRRSGADLANQIAQLLIDIRAQDNEDLVAWRAAHPNQVVPDEVCDVRMKRFTDAIQYMMPHKRFDGVTRKEGRYEINFREFDRISTLQQLSTGEKQIIFRGGFILRDLAAVAGGVVLIDEPELSLHPDWQKRILGFYQRLLRQTHTKTTQLIIATHSPFIVHDQVSAKVIVLKKNAEGGKVEVQETPMYPGAAQSILVEAFNVQSLLSQAEQDTIVLVEGRTDQIILEEAWKKLFASKPMLFEVRPLLGDKNIQVTLNDDQVFKANPGKKLVGLFDFDRAFDQWFGVWKKQSNQLIEADVSRGLLKKHRVESGWAMLLPVPAYRKQLAFEKLGGQSALSIELMFEDAYHLPEMIEHLPLPAVGATKPVMRNAMKRQFAEHVLKLPAEAFIGFAPLFDHLEKIVGD